jgi:hypothetical protein
LQALNCEWNSLIIEIRFVPNFRFADLILPERPPRTLAQMSPGKCLTRRHHIHHALARIDPNNDDQADCHFMVVTPTSSAMKQFRACQVLKIAVPRFMENHGD